MLRNMINNIKKSVCKANEDFIFGTDFADKMGSVSYTHLTLPTILLV